MRRLALLLLLAAGISYGQGTKPRENASAYPSHEKTDGFELGAEYMVHSINNSSLTYVARDFLVVEAAVFPLRKPVSVNPGQFRLRINHRETLAARTPPAVAASMNHPNDEYHPHTEMTAGIGDATVTAGRPMETGRFPGDPRTPKPWPGSKSPSVSEQAGVETSQQEPLDVFLQKAALPEGELRFPSAGLLFFYYHGKTSKIKSLELVYTGQDGKETSLSLL